MRGAQNRQRRDDKEPTEKTRKKNEGANLPAPRPSRTAAQSRTALPAARANSGRRGRAEIFEI
jgi:hypothetical protein